MYIYAFKHAATGCYQFTCTKMYTGRSASVVFAFNRGHAKSTEFIRVALNSIVRYRYSKIGSKKDTCSDRRKDYEKMKVCLLSGSYFIMSGL